MTPGLYIHLPFCSAICPYCDFYVLTGDSGRRARYVEHLLAEIDACGARPWPAFVGDPPSSPFDTIYLGGGTPSLLEPELLCAILEAVRGALPVVESPWIALEANPEDLTQDRLESWREMRVRFLSVGVQSLSRGSLEFLGRRHRPGDGRRSVRLAKNAGLPTVSIDLIYGLPGQTPGRWRAELEAAIGLHPDHLSCYQLTIEDGTPFGFRRRRGELAEASRGRQADLFFLTHRVLEDHGMAAYEVSNFAAAPRHQSRHNRKYWEHAPYLGLGPSAHSFAGRQRWWNERKLKAWQSGIEADRRPIRAHEDLTAGQLCLERLMLGMRTPSGVDLDRLPAGIGSRLWQSNLELIEGLSERGLVRVEGRRLRPTLAGLAVAEALVREFEIPSVTPTVC